MHIQETELNLARIAQRVSEGGHSVPEEKVLARIPRTTENIKTVLPLVDIAHFYDNSSMEKPLMSVAKLTEGKIQQYGQTLPDWAIHVLSDFI